MLAAKLARLSTVGFVSIIHKTPNVLLSGSKSVKGQCFLIQTQNIGSQTGRSTLRRARAPDVKQAIKDSATKPAGDTAFNLGRAAVGGASIVGLGALCYYGLGMSNQLGAIDKAVMWSDLVKHRIRDTYMYFGGSLMFTAASAVAIARNPTMIRLVSQNGWKSLVGTIAAMWGSGMLCMGLPYQKGFGTKQMAWILHSSVIGAVIAPLTLLGGPLMIRAACYTAGIVGGLSTLAICAPSEKFLNMGGPLAMGLGVVFASSIGTWFLPPSTAMGAGLMSVAVYGGLIVFGMFLLYDTQKIIKRAETHSSFDMKPFDPINNAVGVYLDTINIFIRMVMILSGNRKK